jgi:hydrogenase maturation protease
VGVGNSWRGDDAAGLVTARRLRGLLCDVEVVEREGEPLALVETWSHYAALWIVDAVSSGAPAGTVHRLEAGERELPHELFRASTHAFGVAESVELARALGTLPGQVVVYGIEGSSFAAGEGLSAEVEQAVDGVVDAVREEVERFTSGR